MDKRKTGDRSQSYTWFMDQRKTGGGPPPYTWFLDQPDLDSLVIIVTVADPHRAAGFSVKRSKVDRKTPWHGAEARDNVDGGKASVVEFSRTYAVACRKAYSRALKWLHTELGTGQKAPRRLP